MLEHLSRVNLHITWLSLMVNLSQWQALGLKVAPI